MPTCSARPMPSPAICAPPARPISLCWWLPGSSCARRWDNDPEMKEEAMTTTRRDLAAAGALAFGATALIGSARAESADDGVVKKAVDELRTAVLKQDKAKLD